MYVYELCQTKKSREECDVVSIEFFFQAEDGIRDLVRSRGLGDVYKRQINGCVAERPIAAACKAVSHGTRWFESIRTHQPYRASSTGRAAASKAEGSRFDSVVRCQTSRRSQVVEGGGLQSRRRKPASVRIGSSSPGLVSSADESGRLLPGGSAVRIGHEAPVHFPDSADGRAPGC